MTEAVWDSRFASAVLPATMKGHFTCYGQLRPSMGGSELFDRYRDLQAYVGWTDEDAARVRRFSDNVKERLQELVDDFYAELERHPETAHIITGGAAQIERLKDSLKAWLCESLECRCDSDYVARRWNIGLRHAEIGLNPAYTSAAMSRLRTGLISIVAQSHTDSTVELCKLVQSFDKLLDVDLAVIQDAYQAEYLKREKQLERERSEVKFRLLVEAAGCMVVILRPNRTVAYFSPYSEELTGYAAADLLDKDFQSLFIPEWAREDVAKAIDATLGGQPTNSYESPLTCRDGTQRWLVWNTRRLDSFDGGPAVLAVGQDFTAWRDAQERMVQSERLAGIGQMVTGIAHESRNSLQWIQSSTEMLEIVNADNDKALRHIQRIQAAQDNLQRLFDEVRSFAAPIHLEYTTCRLDGAWQEAWNSLQALWHDRDAALTSTTDGVDLTISVDRFRMVQLFRNLLENSLAACRDPARIHVLCRDVQFQQQPAVEVRMRDNGPGLAPEARGSVFEPFYTTKTKGTGLGMAIARRIVGAHGGQISVGDPDAGGAEFVVTLPRSLP
jgi:PAS domain S-box-containing protein